MLREIQPIITLATDFGLERDNKRAVAAALSINPTLQIESLTHEIPPYNVLSGAWGLLDDYKGWPKGSIHVVVVDPGVGTNRAGLIIESVRGDVFIGPDTGVLLPASRDAGIKSVHKINREYLEAGELSTFDARDLFLPAAAKIALGEPISEVGRRISEREIKDFSFKQNQVVHEDGFGNLKIENYNSGYVPGETVLRVEVSWGQVNIPFHKTFEDVSEGKLLAYSGSSNGRLEFGVNLGKVEEGNRAVDVLRLQPGDIVDIAPIRMRLVRAMIDDFAPVMTAAAR